MQPRILLIQLQPNSSTDKIHPWINASHSHFDHTLQPSLLPIDSELCHAIVIFTNAKLSRSLSVQSWISLADSVCRHKYRKPLATCCQANLEFPLTSVLVWKQVCIDTSHCKCKSATFTLKMNQSEVWKSISDVRFSEKRFQPFPLSL